MSDPTTVLLVIKPLSAYGHFLLGSRWESCLRSLRDSLSQAGRADERGQSDLLVFRFPGVEAARQAFHTALGQAALSGWPKAHGGAPVVAICGLTAAEETTFTLFPPDPLADVWSRLEPGQIYLTRDARGLAGDPNAEALSSAPPDSLPLPPTRLIPARQQLHRGPHPPCFYCGVRLHPPARCPSKHLTIEIHGLQEASRLQPSALNDALQQLAGGESRFIEALHHGLKQTDLRDKPFLIGAVALYDANRCLQLRTLHHLYHNPHGRWPGIGPVRSETASEDADFNLGLDCLRVGRHVQAWDIFASRIRSAGRRRFYANIGKAFVALEEKSPAAMIVTLEQNSLSAEHEIDRVYIQLLLARAYGLSGNLDAARQAARSALKIDRYCQEANYLLLKIGLAESGGSLDTEALSHLAAADMGYQSAILVDPELCPVEQLVESTAADLFEVMYTSAAQDLNEVAEARRGLAAWVGPGDAELENLSTRLENLRQALGEAGPGGVIDISQKAKPLALECRRILQSKFEVINGVLRELHGRFSALALFWQKYPYPGRFARYGSQLIGQANGIQAAVEKVANRAFTGQAEADATLESIRRSLDELAEMQPGMRRTQMLLTFGQAFWRSLLFWEAIALGLGLVLLPVAGLLIPAGVADAWPALQAGSRAHAELLMLFCWVFAPAVALVHSLTAPTPNT